MSFLPDRMQRAALIVGVSGLASGLSQYLTLCLARAAPPSLQIQLQLSPCIELDEKEIRRLLRIELGAELVPQGAPTPPSTPRAHVTCEPDRLLIRIEDPITRKSLERRLALRTAAPATRARLLALALAELLLASWAELTLEQRSEPELTTALPPPSAVPERPPAEAQASVAAPVETSRLAATELVRKHHAEPLLMPLQLGACGVFLSFPSYAATSLFGGAVRLAGDLRYRLHWQLELHGQYGSQSVAAGSLSATLFAATLALHYQHVLGAFRLRAGVGGRLGAAWLRGQPQDADSVLGMDLWGPFAGPLLRVGGARLLPRRLLLDAALEAGYAPIAVRGTVDGARALGIEGLWLGVQLGLSRSL